MWAQSITGFGVQASSLRLTGACVLVGLGAAAGCGAGRFELAAADTLLATAGQVELTISEYHQEVSQSDDSRESAVVSAFLARVATDKDDPSVLESHAADFEAALLKIRADRETEWQRRAAAMENVGLLREVAAGLQRLAVERLTLEDEARRYLSGWIERHRRTSGQQPAGGSGY